MQRYELDAWLGDNPGLTEEQITDLLATADDIATRYPNEDDTDEREAALTAAYRAMVEGMAIVDELAQTVAAGRLAAVGLRQVARSLIPAGQETEANFARRAGVDRMTVRNWLGKR